MNFMINCTNNCRGEYLDLIDIIIRSKLLRLILLTIILTLKLHSTWKWLTTLH